MTDLIGYCGYNCSMCACRSEDPKVRLKMVEGWKKIYGHTMYTAENMPACKPCPGCKGEGEVADKVCQARPCAIEKGVESCTDCNEFPCKKMSHLMGERLGLLIYCFKRPDVSKEEYELCAKQFESMPNLVKKLIEKKRIPSWAKELLEKD